MYRDPPRLNAHFFRPDRDRLDAICGAAGAPPPPKVTRINIYVTSHFQGWRAAALACMRDQFDAATGAMHEGYTDTVIAAVKGHAEFEGKAEKLVKAETMPFIKIKAREAAEGGALVRHFPICFGLH